MRFARSLPFELTPSTEALRHFDEALDGPHVRPSALDGSSAANAVGDWTFSHRGSLPDFEDSTGDSTPRSIRANAASLVVTPIGAESPAQTAKPASLRALHVLQFVAL